MFFGFSTERVASVGHTCALNGKIKIAKVSKLKEISKQRLQTCYIGYWIVKSTCN